MMEFSPLYTRRLSGSSARNSFNEDALEQLEFNINDISRASSPASVTSTSARSEGHGSVFSRDRRHRSSGREEDYRRKYSRMRTELEIERSKARQLQSERVEEMRRMREAYENDRKLEMVAFQNRLEEEKKKEIARVKDELIKQKDFELQQVLMYREGERKQSQTKTTPRMEEVKEQEKQKEKEREKEKEKEKERKVEEQVVEEKERTEAEDDEESGGGKDGDNDVATVSDKGRVKDGGHQDGRRKWRSGAERRSLDLDSKDGGSVHDHRRSSREMKSWRSQDGYEADKESGSIRRRRGASVSKMVEKIEKRDASTVVHDDSLVADLASDNTTSKSVSTSTKDIISTTKDAVTNTKDSSALSSSKDVSMKDIKSSPTKKKMKDDQTQTVHIDDKDDEKVRKEKEQEKEKERERGALMKEFEDKITALESEKLLLAKQKEDVQRTLDMKSKEYKIREEEFVNLKAGYERELRTVINEHKKVALGNLEKLKLAETALKEATLSDEEIAMFSQRHDRQRRLSSSSLPALQFETKKEDREREKNLQKKLGELTTQIQRLERRIALLRTENDTLRKKQDDQRPLEEKIKSLKKRNAELAAIARRLEEKAKALQQENTKVKSKASTSSQDDTSSDGEHLKRVFARQRAKDLADHAKNMLAKDKEIEELRRKCQELADQLSNGEVMAPQNAPQFEEKEELVNIIKQAAKERLQLEQQLAHSKTKEKSPGEDPRADAERQEQLAANEKHRQELEEANQILHKEIEKLEQALHKAETLEQQLTEKSNECNALTKELTQTKHQKQQVESRLTTVTAQNEELTSQLKDLQEKVKNAETITEECNTLKLSLANAQKEREAAQEEVKHLNLRVHSLENLVRDLQESAEHVDKIDNERKTALQQLQQNKALLDQLQQVNSSHESEHTHTVSALNQQIQELEEKRRKEEDRREELSKEVQRLKQEAEERQKALEEAEKLKEQLALKQQEANFIPAPTLVSQTQAALPASIKHKGEEEEGEDDNQVLDKEGMDRKPTNQNERPVGESFLSAWAQKGPIQVYIAKYNYDPFEFSPNENPEAELPLTAGDYVLVVGEMDEDGFFDGELIDGRQGLVPSNFIEKVEDEDLVEFHAALMQAGHGDYSNTNNNSTPTVPAAEATTSQAITSGIVFNNNNNNSLNNNNELAGQAKIDLQNGAGGVVEESNSDLEDIAEIDEDTVSISSRVLANGGTISNLPPCPRSLSLDRQLTNSLLVSWKGPEPVPGLEVQSYHVLVDGDLKTSVKSSERTKALLEGISTNDTHRICIRCLSNRGQSKDAQCTMVVGKDVYPVPSDMKVSHVSPTSASLSWLPGNSNYQHSIIVNGKEVRVVKPGVFRHTLSGLTPGTSYKVTLIAKSISGVLNEEKSRKWVENVSASIEFRTPEAGAPEPPLNVQVESGPREGTLLLTWLPVTINSSGVCNGAVVAGYHVMADGEKVKLVSGPTSDHVVLSSEDFKGLIPTELSVRTVSTSAVESVDSDMVRIPTVLLKEMSECATKEVIKVSVTKAPKSPGGEEHRGHDTDEEIEEAFREAQTTSDGVNALFGDNYSNSSTSELSDIPEVEEDLIGSQDSHLNEVGIQPTNQPPSPSQVGKASPQPAPRKLAGGGADSGPKEFHAQKPLGDGGKLLAAPARVVPAIEITRDSSTERGTSVDEETEEGSTPSARNTPTNVSGRPPDAAISSHYRGDAQNPSAFRQVDQTRNRDSGESVRLAGDEEEHDSYTAHSKGSKVHSSHHPSKSHSSDSRAGHENQGPHHRHSANQSPRSGSTQSPDHRKHLAASSVSPSNGMDEVGDADSISGEINPVVDENTVRLFIALFDYDPATMSPNVDSIDEELPFREGQILKVFGEKDADGFYKGESHGRIGYIPCNMVSEVQIDDPDLVEQLLQETAEKPGKTHPVTTGSALTDNRDRDSQLTPNGVASVPREGPMRKMIAMYDYDPQELSPNVDAELELSFKTGDTVMVYGDMDEDGFFSGEVNGQQGLVPSNFLQPAPSSDDEGLESASLVSAPRSRSGESLDASLNALGRTDIATNAPKIGDQLPTSSETVTSNKQPVNASFAEIKSEDTRSGTASPADEEKPKKKGGFLNKSRNIFKKFTR